MSTMPMKVELMLNNIMAAQIYLGHKCHLGKYVVGETNISGTYDGGAQFVASLESKYIIGLS
jgi:hypothetical protein